MRCECLCRTRRCFTVLKHLQNIYRVNLNKLHTSMRISCLRGEAKHAQGTSRGPPAPSQPQLTLCFSSLSLYHMDQGVKVISEGLHGVPIYLQRLQNFPQIGVNWGAEQRAMGWPSPFTLVPSCSPCSLTQMRKQAAVYRFFTPSLLLSFTLHLSIYF